MTSLVKHVVRALHAKHGWVTLAWAAFAAIVFSTLGLLIAAEMLMKFHSEGRLHLALAVVAAVLAGAVGLRWASRTPRLSAARQVLQRGLDAIDHGIAATSAKVGRLIAYLVGIAVSIAIFAGLVTLFFAYPLPMIAIGIFLLVIVIGARN